MGAIAKKSSSPSKDSTSKSWPEAVRFLPWIGNQYGNSALEIPRLLVLGHSHYEDVVQPSPPGESARLDFTSEVVRKHISGSDGQATFARLEKMMFLSRLEGADRERAWNSMAFANYIQVFFPEGQYKPRAVHWNTGRQAYCPLLDMLKPQVILVLGITTYEQLPHEDRTDRVFGCSRTCWYDRPWGSCFAIELKHPARVSDPENWNVGLKQAIAYWTSLQKAG